MKRGPNFKDIAGNKYNKLTVIKLIGKARDGSSKWQCLCDCGKETSYTTKHLIRKKNPVKSCGCHRASLKGSNHVQWTGYEGISGSWWQSHVLREYKMSKRPKVPVTITIQEAWDLLVRQNFKCSLSNLTIFVGDNSINGTASLDRIDSSKGYELGNVQWTHKHINFMKYTHTQTYFIELCKKVANAN